MTVQPQQQVSGSSNEILGISLGSSNTSHYTKLEFPDFNGDDLIKWLYEAEQFFKIDNTMDAIKVKLATIHFEGKALYWFKAFLSTKEKEKLILWDEFMEVLIARFGE